MSARSAPLCCPHCAAPLAGEAVAPLAHEARCGGCGRVFPERQGYLDFIAGDARGAAAREVTEFYERFPFPGYAPADDATTLLERSRRSAFLVQLDQAIPPDALVLDCGCGTGQLAAFLCLSSPRRRVVGVDACPVSLGAAAGFKARAGLDNLSLYLCDLFRLPLPPGAFEVVISRGVVHHTPDPAGAMRAVAGQVAPGGRLVLGFYESWARAPHVARRWLGRGGRKPIRALDPVLRRRDLSEEKKGIWIADQYRHPLERLLAFPAVVEELEAAGLVWTRSYPPTVESGTLFDPTDRPGKLALSLRRLGWAWACLSDADAGLVSVVMRRPGGV